MSELPTDFWDWNPAKRESYWKAKPFVPADTSVLAKARHPNGDEQRHSNQEWRDAGLPPEERAEMRPNGETGTAPKRFDIVPFDEITFDPAPAYSVKGLLCSTGLIVVWGAPKCGKSFWVFDLVMHVALGWPYRERKVRQGTVVYCALEGCAAFKNRIEAFRQEHLSEVASGVPFHLMASPLSLIADHAALVASIRELALAPAIVVIDTLNRSLAGSESSDEDMSKYIQAADAIRAAFNCAVVIVHHCGHEGTRPRGHSSLLGALDVQIGVVRDAANNIVATVELMKDGEAGAKIVSRLESKQVGVDSDGDAVTSCVIVEGDPGAVPPPKKNRPDHVEILNSYDALAEREPKMPGHTNKLVRKAPVSAIRDDLKKRGFLEIDEKGNLTARGRKQLYDAKTHWLKNGTFVEEDGMIWRP